MNVTINVYFIKKDFFKVCIREIAHIFLQIYIVSGIIKESWVLISDSTSNLLQYGQAIRTKFSLTRSTCS